MKIGHWGSIFEFLSFRILKPSYKNPGFPWFVLKCSILICKCDCVEKNKAKTE